MVACRYLSVSESNDVPITRADNMAAAIFEGRS